jgi:nitrite reductase/ring-hydroxylating ferredoxin subunit
MASDEAKKKREIRSPEHGTVDEEGWVRVADLKDIEEGQTISVTVDAKSIVLTRHNGEVGALDAQCPHQGGPLDQGSIEQGLLRCPWHGWGFDPLTGEVVEGDSQDVTSYPAELRGGSIYVRTQTEEENST